MIYPNHESTATRPGLRPGDVLRAADALKYGWDMDLSATGSWLLRGQDASGGIQTARGFSRQAARGLNARRARGSPVPMRDVLHIVGCVTKRFATWRPTSAAELPTGTGAPLRRRVPFAQSMHLIETPDALEISAVVASVLSLAQGQSVGGDRLPRILAALMVKSMGMENGRFCLS